MIKGMESLPHEKKLKQHGIFSLGTSGLSWDRTSLTNMYNINT